MTCPHAQTQGNPRIGEVGEWTELPGVVPSWDWARLLAAIGLLVVAGAAALVLACRDSAAAEPDGSRSWSSSGPRMRQEPIEELPYTGDALLVETLDPTTGELLVLGVVVVTVAGEARHRPRSGPVVD